MFKKIENIPFDQLSPAGHLLFLRFWIGYFFWCRWVVSNRVVYSIFTKNGNFSHSSAKSDFIFIVPLCTSIFIKKYYIEAKNAYSDNPYCATNKYIVSSEIIAYVEKLKYFASISKDSENTNFLKYFYSNSVWRISVLHKTKLWKRRANIYLVSIYQFWKFLCFQNSFSKTQVLLVFSFHWV